VVEERSPLPKADENQAAEPVKPTEEASPKALPATHVGRAEIRHPISRTTPRRGRPPRLAGPGPAVPVEDRTQVAHGKLVGSAISAERWLRTTRWPYGALAVLAFLVLFAVCVNWFLSSQSRPFLIPTVSPEASDATDQLRIALLRQQVQDGRDEADRLLQVVIGAISIVLVGVTVLVGYSRLANNRLTAEERQNLRATEDRLRQLESDYRLDIAKSQERFLRIELAEINRLINRGRFHQALESLCGVMDEYDYRNVPPQLRTETLQAAQAAVSACQRQKLFLSPWRVEQVITSIAELPTGDSPLRHKITSGARAIQALPTETAEEFE